MVTTNLTPFSRRHTSRRSADSTPCATAVSAVQIGRACCSIARPTRPWHTRPRSATVAAFMMLALMLSRLSAAELPPAATNPVDFERDIQPLLQQRCLGCHNGDKQRGGLRLDRASAVLKGGESLGPAIIPGKSETSPLIHVVAGLEDGFKMPPEGPALTAKEIGLLRAWIDQGAKWPAATTGNDPTASHWSFQPLKNTPPPAVHENEWCRTAIDQFTLAALQDQQLTPSPEADRLTLLRRLSYGLRGLPPTPKEAADFVADTAPDAWERLVDKWLDDPHYGERWARHWLDVVRFAESNGFEMNQSRPNAWPYRDYVIRAFNEDIPYSQFVTEQLAGDTVGVDEATGFLVGGSWDQVKSPDPVLTMQQRADELHDIVATTGSAFLGLTVGCARCHNHKFDPISQVDYHAIKAVFAGVQHGERPLRRLDEKERSRRLHEIRTELAEIDARAAQREPIADTGSHGTATPRRSAVTSGTNIERFLPREVKFVRMVIDETNNQSQPCIDELELFTTESTPRNVALASHGATVAASSTLPGYPIHQLKHLNDGKYSNSWSWISNEPGRGTVTVTLPQVERIDRLVWSRDRGDGMRFNDRIATRYRFEVSLDGERWDVVATSADRVPFGTNSLARTLASDDDAARRFVLQNELAQLTSSPMVYAGRFVAPEPILRLHRGDPTQPREPITPSGLSAFGDRWQLSADAADAERRQALAKWITDPRHPLTARVIVNRLWQHHFGRGPVDTPSDFGLNGAKPTHPELLDWLASELIRHNGSLKAIQRLIVTSAVYRQSSAARLDALTVDADARFLWRFPPQRLEAEPLRDAILSVSGNLDDRMGGPGFDLFESNGNYVKVYQSRRSFGPTEWRRMVYQAKPRMQLDDTFGQFDCPDAGQIAPKRTTSTTALQALNLLNSPFLLQQSKRLAQRIQQETGDDSRKQVRRLFELLFLRSPRDEETADAVELIQSHGLPALCRALLNANEFLYVF